MTAMKTRLLIFLSWFCLGFTMVSLPAQNEGKEFWFTDGMAGCALAYYYPNQALDSAIIYVLGQTYCTGYIENPYTSYHVDFEVHPGVMTKVMVPEEEMTPILNFWDFVTAEYPSSVLQGGSIVIRTTQKVQAWVQTFNSYFQPDDWNAFITGFQRYTGCANKIALYPTDMHSTNYHPHGIFNILLFVIATEDNTQLYLENDTVMLNQGEVYFSKRGCDIATNCKRIIVYEGNFRYVEESLFYQYCLKGRDFLLRVPGKINFGMMAVRVSNTLSYTVYPYEAWNSIAVYHSPFHDYFPFPQYLSESPYVEDSVPYACIRYQQEPEVIGRYLTNKVFSNIHFDTHGFYSDGIWVSSGNFSYVYDKPTELMVTRWSCPISKNTYHLPSFLLDTTYTVLTVYVHADGIGSTYLNGSLVPSSAFVPFPGTNGEYYSAQWNWVNMDTFPDYITIENSHGLSAYMDEIGYSYLPSNSAWGDIMKEAYYMHRSSGFDFMSLPIPHSSLSAINYDTVYRCMGDTLRLRVEHNPDSVPVEWIYNGDSYMASELSFLLPQVDTLTAQLVLHYDYCPDTTTTFVVVVPPPLLEVCHDTTLCHGAYLSVEQPNVLSYLWSDGSSGPALSVDSAGAYSVTVTNLGCRAESDLFTIDLYPQSSVHFGNDSILCELATLLLDATQLHPAAYVWQDQSTNTTYTVYEDGTYWVVVTDHCLGASDTINIGYLNDFTVDLGPDTTICEGRTLTLSAENPFCDYEWQDGSTQPTYIVRHPGTYSVTASNQCFEHGDDIVVEYEPCEQELWMPNSFTPDGDGLNDLFLPVFAYPDEVESFEMTIYDRWGSVQYMTRRLDQGWDAAGVPDGVYVVFIRYKSRGHEVRDVTGSVTVVRN